MDAFLFEAFCNSCQGEALEVVFKNSPDHRGFFGVRRQDSVFPGVAVDGKFIGRETFLVLLQAPLDVLADGPGFFLGKGGKEG